MSEYSVSGSGLHEDQQVEMLIYNNHTMTQKQDKKHLVTVKMSTVFSHELIFTELGKTLTTIAYK